MNAPPIDSRAVRDALEVVARELPRLLRAVPAPGVPAVGVWTVAEVAAHVTHAWAAIPALARGDVDALRRVLPTPLDLHDGSPVASFDGLDAFTQAAVAADPERDLDALARRIEAETPAVLATFAGDAGDADPTPLPWLIAGLRLPLVQFGCHLLNECLVHGADIAAASDLPWPIRRDDAALVLAGFLVPMAQRLAAAGVPTSVPTSLDAATDPVALLMSIWRQG